MGCRVLLQMQSNMHARDLLYFSVPESHEVQDSPANLVNQLLLFHTGTAHVACVTNASGPANLIITQS